MILQDGQRIVFAGDSITDCGRTNGDEHQLGQGYVSLLHAFVTARYPRRRLTWINRGVSGDTVRDLKRRWERDIIAMDPDWLSVMIGINDVWRRYQGWLEESVPVEEYEATLRELLTDAVRRTGCGLILAEPYLIEPDQTDSHRMDSDRYVEVVRALAAEFGAVAVRTQEAFDSVLVSTQRQQWAQDRIHPSLAGHAVIADAFLSVLEGDRLTDGLSALR